VRGLLAEQFPALDASSARLLGEGWDNSVWVVEERWAFRFPRREIAVPLVERELAVLPRVASRLPAPVPRPVHVGRPSERYPWPFFGCELLAGVEPCDAELGEPDRVELGVELGSFLRALHDSATREAADAERALHVDPNRRADMAVRVPRTRAQLGELERLGSWSASEEVEPLLRDAEMLAPAADEVLLHGDLHVRHVLVERGRLSGVIDWGDVCAGDPAIDLALYWSLLSPDGRAAFVAGYGPLPGERLLRARVLSLSLCAILALYARDVGHASLEREALMGLDRTLVG
jgi:aminoglycoside phosphotransferase (APT) family kinase protein